MPLHPTRRDVPERQGRYVVLVWRAGNVGEAVKRGYSRDFTPRTETHARYLLDKIPPALWIRVRAKAKREGVSLRALILGWCKEWVEK